MKLHVRNFDEHVGNEDLARIFGRHGSVWKVTIWTHWRTGRSLGFGFVEMPDKKAAKRAIEKINGHFWNGRRLKVSKAVNQRW